MLGSRFAAPERYGQSGVAGRLPVVPSGLGEPWCCGIGETDGFWLGTPLKTNGKAHPSSATRPIDHSVQELFFSGP